LKWKKTFNPKEPSWRDVFGYLNNPSRRWNGGVYSEFISGLQHGDIGDGLPDYGGGGDLFQKLCGNVTTAMLYHHRMLREV